MPKTKEAYRGQDRTFEMIREHTRDGVCLWNDGCKIEYDKMVAEGLRTTADEILKHVALEPGQEIIKTSDSFRIVRTGGLIKGATENWGGIVKANAEAVVPMTKEQIGIEPSDGATVHVNITDEDLGIK